MQKNSEDLTANAAIKRLQRFEGTWKTSGSMRDEHGDDIAFYGTDRYEWLTGGFFMIHNADVVMGDQRIVTLEIIGYDAEAERYTMQHFNNLGETGKMVAMEKDGRWHFLSDELRFQGGFNEDGNVLSGIWERLDDGTWTQLMKINLTKEA